MVDTKVTVDLQGGLPLQAIREMQHKVERAGEIAGAAHAVADSLRDAAALVGTPLSMTPHMAQVLADMATRLEAACGRAHQHLTPVDTVQPGDVVQVDPQHDEDGYGGAFAIVEKDLGWGVVAYVRLPGPQGGSAWVRLGHGQCRKVGVAEWQHDPSAVVGGITLAQHAALAVALPARWRAAMDDGTCWACVSREGTLVDSGSPAPPHPQCTSPSGCRCVVVAEGEPRVAR